MDSSNQEQKTEPVPIEVKEAEVKLKEMSRKAKERKTQTAPRKPPTPKKSNFNLLLVGGLGVGILGVLYLVFRKPKEDWVFTPNEEPVKKEASPPSAPEPKKERKQMTKPEF